MVLEKIGLTIQNSLKKLLKLTIVDEAAIKELIKDIQRTLLQSDVNVRLVFELSKRLEDRALHEELPPGFSRKEHVIKILYEEFTRFLGEKPAKIPIEPGKRNVIMLVGIQGSGKTTTAIKIARFLRKRGVRVAVVCADTYRPGAFSQLRQLAYQAGVPVYGDENVKDAVKLVMDGVKKFSEEGFEAILIDTAGRHKDEKSLMEEMKNLAETIKPDHIILVIDGTIGQQAMTQAEAFNNTTRIGSIVVTKLDGSARGGGALSAVVATKAPITFIGTGEKIDDIELFDPPRFVGRLLGMGDLKSLLEKVSEAELTVPKERVKSILAGKFTLEDLYNEIERVKKIGPLGKILKMIPGLSFQLEDSVLRITEDKMEAWKAIIQSMTKEERENPKILNASRIRRIARGSGRSEAEVKELVKQFEVTKKALKSLRRQFPVKMFKKDSFNF
ncbi:MAG: signal recognition particle protein Srp54 [Candidatus Bathyarchaeota archaeon]|nr:signal recognition particle protein Srp54 [Candidatus Bathyarchaeota archaeon]